AASLVTLYPSGPLAVSRLTTSFLRPASLASVLSFLSMPESSQQNTTQLFISSFFVQQASIFWSSALTSGVASRAKIIATGLAPKRQYRQDFSPAAGPVMFSGSNGPGTLSPTCGPDFTFSAATRPPQTR